jgi:hypothetical protein
MSTAALGCEQIREIASPIDIPGDTPVFGCLDLPHTGETESRSGVALARLGFTLDDERDDILAAGWRTGAVGGGGGGRGLLVAVGRRFTARRDAHGGRNVSANFDSSAYEEGSSTGSTVSDRCARWVPTLCIRRVQLRLRTAIHSG